MEKWDQVMSVNLRGLMLSYKYAAMQMIQQGRGGRIIGKFSVNQSRYQYHEANVNFFEGASSIAGKRGQVIFQMSFIGDSRPLTGS